MTDAFLGLPQQGDAAFDAYMVEEGFLKIQRVAVMETFLLGAARRLHVLEAEEAALGLDESLPPVKERAIAFLREQFSVAISDLSMVFSETDDYYEQSSSERKRLNNVADLLVCSARDPSSKRSGLRQRKTPIRERSCSRRSGPSNLLPRTEVKMPSNRNTRMHGWVGENIATTRSPLPLDHATWRTK